MSYLDPRTILSRLTPRDLAVLDDIERFRLLSTRLIQRLHFPLTTDPSATSGHASAGAATKAAMRVLTRLASHGLIGHLERRIGGVRHGSQGFVWQLTSTGANVQRIRRGETGKRRYTEPSPHFTDHTLAIADVATTIRDLARTDNLEMIRMQTEPECWREYTGIHGITQTLKPDLYAVTATAEFEDHVFLEADLGTEHLPQVLTKCRAYAAYHATGIEQHTHGVFPLVVWVTDTPARAAQMRRAIHADTTLPQELFAVTTTDTFPASLVGDLPSAPAIPSLETDTPRKEEPPHGTHPRTALPPHR